MSFHQGGQRCYEVFLMKPIVVLIVGAWTSRSSMGLDVPQPSNRIFQNLSASNGLAVF